MAARFASGTRREKVDLAVETEGELLVPHTDVTGAVGEPRVGREDAVIDGDVHVDEAAAVAEVEARRRLGEEVHDVEARRLRRRARAERR